MLEVISTYILSLFPEGFKPMDMVHSRLYIIAIAVIVAVGIRMIHKKASQYNHALSSAMALLFMYLLLIQLHKLVPDIVDPLLDKLPLVDMDLENGTVSLFQFSAKNFSASCAEFLNLFILSFCLIGLDDLIPDAKNVTSWMILQFIIVCLSMAIYTFLLKCINHFCPDLLSSYAPMILVCILLFMVFLGLLKVVLTMMLVAVNPLLIAISAFFSGNKLGLALGKAVMCSLVLVLVSLFMYHKSFMVFALADLTFLVCMLPMIVLGMLWVVIGHIL